jgi:DNA mismatch endonuclease Vsr
VNNPVPGGSPHGARLARQRQKDTRPELRVGAILRALGVAYRKNVRGLPGSPDFANRHGGWAIFVQGCFWHAHRGCRKATKPKTNTPFWAEKFARNRSRDANAVVALRKLGFRVLLVWECEIDLAPERLSKVFKARRVDVGQPIDH